MLKILIFTGAAHAVDSSELAFRLAAIGAVKQGNYLSNASHAQEGSSVNNFLLSCFLQMLFSHQNQQCFQRH